MQKITLASNGKDVYEFYGEKIADAISSVVNNRWHEISVYRASNNKYVLAVSYRTTENNETNIDFVEVFDRLFSLDAKLKTDAREYFPIILGKDEEFASKTCIPLETSFSAAWSNLSLNIRHLIKAELTDEI